MRQKVKIMIYKLAIAKKSDLWYINSQLQDKKYLWEKKVRIARKKSPNYEI